MIDRDEIKKMWVWDGDISNPREDKRYVLYKTTGGYMCVTKNTAYIFEMDWDYMNLVEWKHCEEIKEPEWRAFEIGEMPREYLNYTYRKKGDNLILSPVCYDCSARINAQLQFVNEWVSFWIDNSELYADWEVLINNKWQFIGVKEE